MSKYSRERSPLSPIRYERTAGHSRSAKSPISISKSYSSNSYKGLNSYGGKNYDKKYSKHDNGYKDYLDDKYSSREWIPKDDYKLENSRKSNSYKDHYKSPINERKYEKTSYKNDYKRPLTRDRSPKYDKSYYKDDYKRLDKDAFPIKTDYKYKDYLPSDSYKSVTKYKDDFYLKRSLSHGFKDSAKKNPYSPPPSFSPRSSKDFYRKSSNKIKINELSQYKGGILYEDKRYNTYPSQKSYEKFNFKDKYYEDDLDYTIKYESKDLKKSYRNLDGRKDLPDRKNNLYGAYDSYLLPDEYSPRNNNSYERYVIGDSVVYGSPRHEDEYSSNTRTSRLDSFSSLLPDRKTNSSRFSVIPSRYRKNDSFKKKSRLSPLILKKSLLPLKSLDKSRTPLNNKRHSSSHHKNKDDYNRDYSHRSNSLKRSLSTSKKRRSDSYDDISKNSHHKRRLSSPPKPLLSIRLPANSIPRASRMYIDQTVSIRDQVNPRRNRTSNVGPRLDGRLGRGDTVRSRDRPTKSSDLRLWIESRKNVNKKVAKIFPTKSKQSRRENLSAIANRVRLLEARKRALQNGRNQRIALKRTTEITRNKLKRERSARSPKAINESSKRSRSPMQKESKKVLTERRHISSKTKTSKSASTKRKSTNTKLLKSSTTKGGIPKKSRRSPVKSRQSTLSKKAHRY